MKIESPATDETVTPSPLRSVKLPAMEPPASVDSSASISWVANRKKVCVVDERFVTVKFSVMLSFMPEAPSMSQFTFQPPLESEPVNR